MLLLLMFVTMVVVTVVTAALMVVVMMPSILIVRSYPKEEEIWAAENIGYVKSAQCLSHQSVLD